MAQQTLQGKTVAMLAANGVERVELVEPRRALEAAGAAVHLISLAKGEIQSLNGTEKAERFAVDRAIAEAHAADYAALVIPGGEASPGALRANADVVQLVREFMEADKPVAAICHGIALLVEADVLQGRTVTSNPDLQTDVRKAGGDWVNETVHVDQKLITSRNPQDLPAFCAKITGSFSAAIRESKLDEALVQSFPASDPLPGPSAIGMEGKSRDAGA